MFFYVDHNGDGILIFDPKDKPKDKRSIFEIHFLFNLKYGSDSISSQELYDVGILGR